MAKMACKGSQPRHWGVQIQTGKRARPKGRGSSGRSIPLRPAKEIQVQAVALEIQVTFNDDLNRAKT